MQTTKKQHGPDCGCAYRQIMPTYAGQQPQDSQDNAIKPRIAAANGHINTPPKYQVGADKIFKAKNIITMDDTQPQVSAVAIRGDRIVAMGDEQAIKKWITPDTEVIDFGNKALMPGFIESHCHPLIHGILLNYTQVDSTVCPKRDDIFNALKQAARQKEPGRWLIGWGYDQSQLSDQRTPTRDELDAITPDHPCYIVHGSLHMLYLNSKALELAGIDETTQVPGGVFIKDAQGRLTGEAREVAAVRHVLDKQPGITFSQMLDVAQNVGQVFKKVGCTSIMDCGAGFATPADDLHIYQEAVKLPNYPVRVSAMPVHSYLDQMLVHTGYGDEQFRIGAIKFIIDGSVQGYTANLTQPYHNDPQNFGMCTMPDDIFREKLLKAHQRGFQVAIHANGDGAIEQAINAIEYALSLYPRENHRHRIEHCQMATEEQLQRMAKLGILANFFVTHTHIWGDIHYNETLGPERGSRISPMASAIKLGIPVTVHSDAPVTQPNPLFCAWAAVNRTTRSGKILGKEQRISVEQALKAITVDAAYFNFEEHCKGSITPGKLADFVVLEQSPYDVAPEALKDLEINTTILGGQIL